MPIHANPKDREEWAVLPAMVPLPVKVIEKPKEKSSSYEDSNPTLKLVLEVFDGPYAHTYQGKPSKFMIYPGITMAPSNAGVKSNLRQLVEAVYGPLTDEQAWALDLEQLMGQVFVLVGNYTKPDAERPRLKPVGYKRYVAAEFAGQAPVPSTNGASDDYQYQDHPTMGRIRWRQGMANWEPVPVQPVTPPAAPPATPPPVPAATAPPPAPAVPPPAAADKPAINF